MIDLKGTMGIPLLERSRFTGSDGTLRFVLEKRSGESVPADALWPGRKTGDGDIPAEVSPEGAGTPVGDCLATVCWHGLYASDVTPEEEKTIAYFPFTNEGLAQAQAWLNAQR